jgi:hypothetical protein
MKGEWATVRRILGMGLMVAGLIWGAVVQMHGEAALVGAARAVSQVQGSGGSDSPRFQNAHVEKRAVRGTLREEVRNWSNTTTAARWLGYSVVAVEGDRTVCCSNWDGASHGCGVCQLERDHEGSQVNSNGDEKSTVRLEGSRRLTVLFRAENGKIEKIREFSAECVVDAGGKNVLWLEGAKDSESVEMLAGYVKSEKSGGDGDESLGKSALTAIALHGDASAEKVLLSFVEPEQPEWFRRDAAFWLGAARGADGFHALQKMAHDDPSSRVREQVTFALSVSKEPGAVNEMIRMAHEDTSAQVRGQALFWLAQKAGKKAVGAIDGAIQNDPDTEVKKKAVFALSQLPHDEGVPKLIDVAQTNKNPEVRKQAMFWLGQSQDPRALAFFEKVLGP